MPRDRHQGLPRASRLRRRHEFRKVYDSGLRVAGRHMVVFVLESELEPATCRVGVTASRRVGGAVVRARCKRRLRELFRLHRWNPAGVGVDLVLNARASCASAPWYELVEDYLACMTRIEQRLSRC